jgi:hypothetical protein
MKIDDFEPHLNQTFALSHPEGDLDMTLVEVSRRGQSTRDGGAFALLWEAPREPLLPQGIYQFSRAEMGSFDMFIVPVGQFETCTQYEAVYS